MIQSGGDALEMWVFALLCRFKIFKLCHRTLKFAERRTRQQCDLALSDLIHSGGCIHDHGSTVNVRRNIPVPVMHAWPMPSALKREFPVASRCWESRCTAQHRIQHQYYYYQVLAPGS